MSRRSWLQQSARRPGGGTHAPARAWRERDAAALDEAYAEARALDAAYAEADAYDAARLATLDADADLDAQPDYEREARERRP